MKMDKVQNGIPRIVVESPKGTVTAPDCDSEDKNTEDKPLLPARLGRRNSISLPAGLDDLDLDLIRTAHEKQAVSILK